MNDAERREVIKGRIAGSELTKVRQHQERLPRQRPRGPDRIQRWPGPGKVLLLPRRDRFWGMGPAVRQREVSPGVP